MAKSQSVYAIILNENGTVKFVYEPLRLEQMQKIVGGYIEHVPTTTENLYLVINEEGRYDAILSVSKWNPKLQSMGITNHDYNLIGNIVVISIDDDGEPCIMDTNVVAKFNTV